ncbi:MAG: hypothetical protein WDO73_03020 [Ignavibacteriota bacterium]
MNRLNRADVERARTSQEFLATLPGKYFTAEANRRLDAIVRNMDRPLEMRFDALLLRTSWGNNSDFACDRVTKSQQPARPEEPIENVLLKALGQVDFARILKVRGAPGEKAKPASKQRISQIVKLRQDQGLMARPEDLTNPGRLVPLKEPSAPLKAGEQTVPWKTFSAVWDSAHGELFAQLKEAEEQAAPFVAAAEPYLKKVEEIRDKINRQKLVDFKAAQKGEVPHPGDTEESTESETAAVQSPQRSGPEVHDSADVRSTTPGTVSTPRSHGYGIDTRVRAETLNLKEEESSSSLASSSSSDSSKKKSSLGSNDDDGRKNIRHGEYATARDEVKAIYQAKTNELPSVQFMDRLESILASQGKTFDDYLAIVNLHLGNHWDNPAGFLTYMAKSGFDQPVTAPLEKPKPKCPRCHSDKRRGAILQNGAIVACPDCSTPEWVRELAEQDERRRKGANA